VTDIIVPIARVVDIVIAPEDVPYDLQGQVSGRLQWDAVSEFAHAVGRNRMPQKPLIVEGHDSGVPIIVMVDGDTEASEMQDIALAALDKQEEQIKKTGRAMDFDSMREEYGMVRREDFGQTLSDGLMRNVEYLRTHQRTDPRGREMPWAQKGR
jgi:hypothetical protein